ncbi:hypothetical protein [Thermoleptolyngbya sp.]
MYRLFLKRAIALWLILSATFITLLITDSKSTDQIPFASIAIQPSSGSPVYVPSDIFDCNRGNNWLQCRASLAGQPLEIIETYVHDKKCRAIYAGTSVKCEPDYHIPDLDEPAYQPEDWNYYGYTLRGDLGLSAAQLHGLRWRYWGKNLLMSQSSSNIFYIGLGLSLMGGVLVAVGTWHSPGRWAVGIASFACGIGMTMLLTNRWQISSYDGAMILMILERPSEVDGWAIAAGLGTWISTATLLSFPLSPILRLGTSLLAGVSLFSLLIQSMSIPILVILPLSFLYHLMHPDDTELRAVMYLADFVTGALALLAAFWLYRKRPLNTRRFLSFTCGLGVFSIELLIVLRCLLWVGYIG